MSVLQSQGLRCCSHQPTGQQGLRCCPRQPTSWRTPSGWNHNPAALRPHVEMKGCTRQIASVAADPLSPISGHALTPSQCMTPTALFIGAAGLVATFLLQAKEKRSSVREEPCPDTSMANIPNDARHHQRVLAKARQATHINNAVAYNKSGEFTTAMLELAKALAENSICRTPALLNYNQEEMGNLYRLHIRCTEQPANFATLLQLQEMLGLSQDDAEKIELELMTIPGAFAI